jgi:hypothetical protein
MGITPMEFITPARMRVGMSRNWGARSAAVRLWADQASRMGQDKRKAKGEG